MPVNKKHFELIVLGCSGGPISGRTCAFLLKPAEVKDHKTFGGQKEQGNLLAIDAGTGLSSILEMLDTKDEPDVDYMLCSFSLNLYPKNYTLANLGYEPIPYDDDDEVDSMYLPVDYIEDYIDHTSIDVKIPFSGCQKLQSELTNYQLTNKILNSISGYLITHSHLDHVASLVIDSPAFQKPKKVYGIKPTMESIRNNLFNGSIWPDFVSMGIVQLNTMNVNTSYDRICDRYSIKVFEVSHGSTLNSNGESNRYLSSAFLITDRKYKYSMIIFGDVESDSSSGSPYNEVIWKTISPLINGDSLNTIVIECSTPDIPPPLYGHMSPTNLIHEMLALRKRCVDDKLRYQSDKYRDANDEFYRDYNSQPLDGLNVIIIHVKESLEDRNPRLTILNQLKDFNEIHNLQIKFSMALSGFSLIL